MGGEAEIFSIAQAATPAGGAVEWIERAGGQRQRAALFPAADPIGTVVLSTGRTEFIEKYYEVIGELLARRYTVLAHDWRGQGLSSRLLADPLKGHAAKFADLVGDYTALLDRCRDRLPKPWISLSHSMGGCLTMLALARGERRFSAAIASAPMLGLKVSKQPVLRSIIWLMAHLTPGSYAAGGGSDPFAAAFERDRLTHDQVRYERTRAFLLKYRQLALGGVTWGWVESALEAIGWLQRTPRLAEVTIPVTILGAGDDNLVDNEGQKLVCGRLPHGRYVEVTDAFHEILMETDDIRAVFWREFDMISQAIAPTA